MSDVAQLRARIEQECQAMKQAMTGFAQVASHEIIHRRYEQIGVAQRELALLIGEDEARQVVGEAYTRTIDSSAGARGHAQTHT